MILKSGNSDKRIKHGSVIAYDQEVFLRKLFLSADLDPEPEAVNKNLEREQSEPPVEGVNTLRKLLLIDGCSNQGKYCNVQGKQRDISAYGHSRNYEISRYLLK